MIRVVIVDDQRLVRECIRSWLERAEDIVVAGEAHSGERAREQVRALQPDIVLMDLNMPGMGGLEATRRICAVHPDVKIIGLSMFVDGPLPARLIGAGAQGYVSKEADGDDLIRAVRAVHGGDSFISGDVTAHIIRAGYRDGGEGRLEVLSDRELQVLKLIGDGRDVAEIARDLHISAKTVQGHRRHLLEKLRVGNDVQLARVALDHGLSV